MSGIKEAGPMGGALRGVIAAAASFAVILAGAAYLFLSDMLPVAAMGTVILGTVFLAGGIGGVAAAYGRAKGALTMGAGAGAVASVLYLVTAALLSPGAIQLTIMLKTVIASASGGLFGGALCLGRGNKKSRRKSPAKRKRAGRH